MGLVRFSIIVAANSVLIVGLAVIMAAPFLPQQNGLGGNGA